MSAWDWFNLTGIKLVVVSGIGAVVIVVRNGLEQQRRTSCRLLQDPCLTDDQRRRLERTAW